MKKPQQYHIGIILLLLMLGGITIGKAQTHEFAPIGAEWYYSFQGHWIEGYVRIVSLGDTVIDECQYRVIEKYRHIYSYLYNTYYSYSFGKEYVAQKQDSVLVYRNGHLCPLFDFGAKTGDTWIVPGTEEFCNESFGIVHVVGSGSEEINGQTLRYVLVVDDPNSEWGFAYSNTSNPIKILETIGPVGTYMFPEQRCEMDVSEGGPLRCYHDDEIGPVSYYSGNCDYINHAYQSCEEVSDKGLTVFPNPVKDGFYINIDGEGFVEVFDEMGKKVYCGIINDMNYINISFCPPGMYLLRFVNDSLAQNLLLIKM